MKPKKRTSEAVELARIRKALRECPTKPPLSPFECIKKAVEKPGAAVACSFGNCSVAVLHMALQIKPDIKVIFHNTGVQFPETYKYKDEICRLFGLEHPQFIETKPIKTFWECVEEFGFPAEKRDQFGKPKCCYYLKEGPMLLVRRKYGIRRLITGLRAAESRARMFAIAKLGQYYLHRKHKIWKFHPIAFWTRRQVLEYLEENNIPTNPAYEKYGKERLGCMPCTGYIGWEQVLIRANPALYSLIQKKRGISLISDFDLVEVEDMVLDRCAITSKFQKSTLEDWF